MASAEGALPARLAETAATSVDLYLELGWHEWWVEAVFDACPPAPSPHARLLSQGTPMRLDVVRFAGRPGVAGSDDGAADAASFDAPGAIGADRYGGVVVVDSGASTLRLIKSGAVSTPAGRAGITGSEDGRAADALFNHPEGIGVTAGGYVYVADSGNQIIRQWYPSGNGFFFFSLVTTIAGSPMATGAAAAVRFASGGNRRHPGVRLLHQRLRQPHRPPARRRLPQRERRWPAPAAPASSTAPR